MNGPSLKPGGLGGHASSSRQAATGSEVTCGDEEVESSSSQPKLAPLLQEGQEEPAQVQSMESDLDVFRAQWKKEVARANKSTENSGKENTKTEVSSPSLDKAVPLYMAGMQLEQQGQLYEAMLKYRRALQVEPAVEHAVRKMLAAQKHERHRQRHQSQEHGENGDERLDDNGNPEPSTEKNDAISESDTSSESESESEDDSSEADRVLVKLQQMSLTDRTFCQPATPQMARHISCLPSEVVQLILRWVVSSDVDVRSLEMVGLVCRGLYRLSRDPVLWRRICRRVLGEGCSDPPTQLGWRGMYLSRPHLLFCGCYISRTSYIRSGEVNGYQDSNYRPWHLVRYYRYLRLFPEGVLMMLTTADEPATTVSQLISRPPHRGAAVAGHWRLKNDVLYAVLIPRREKPPRQQQWSRPGRNRRGRDKLVYDPGEQTLHIEWQVQPVRQGRCQLTWQSYRILTQYLNGNEAVQTINLGDQFPPLVFSRVRSYTANSVAPL